MVDLIQERRRWNQHQKILRSAFKRRVDFDGTKTLYLDHHAALHDSAIGSGEVWSFSEQLWDGLSDEHARIVTVGAEHSIVWLVWHLARCEDAAFNIAVNNGQQVLIEGRWTEKMGITASDSGNAMGEAEILDLSRDIEIASLRAYRMAVGERTRQIVKNLHVADLKRSGGAAALDRYRKEGVVLDPAWGIAEYWANSTVAGLMLMPATRHNMVHLNEAFKTKQKLT